MSTASAGLGQVRLEREGHIAVLTLDRPDRRNAMNQAMWRSLDSAVTELEGALPRAVVLTGAGEKAFCAGMDVNTDNPDAADLMTAMQDKDRAPVVAMLTRMRAVLDRLVGLPVPLIAAINGVAFGGGAEMAVRCDLRVMDPGAAIAFSEVRLGLMPDWGGGVGLARVIGRARATDLVLTARRVAADEALSLGLVSRVSAPSACLAATLIASGECVFGVGAFLSRTPPSFPDP